MSERLPGQYEALVRNELDKDANRGVTYYQIAKAAGVDKTIMSRLFSGQRSMSLSVAERLAVYYGIGVTPPGKRKR